MAPYQVHISLIFNQHEGPNTSKRKYFSLLFPFLAVAAEESKADKAKYGLFVNTFEAKETQHGVTGKVYAVDKSKLFIKGFSLDTSAVDAFFFIKMKGSTDKLQIDYPTAGVQ